MTHSNHKSLAVGHLDAAHNYAIDADHLRHEIASKDFATAGEAHRLRTLDHAVRHGQRQGQGHALLAILDKLEEIKAMLDDGRLSADEVDALIAQGERGL